MRILHAVTVPVTVQAFLHGQLADLADAGHEVHLVCSPGPALDTLDPRVTVHRVPMSRDPEPLPDLRALLALVRLLRRVRPVVTVVGTPKAGLLVGLAAWLVRVPRRCYLLRGLRLESARGTRRALLTALEVLACRCAHQVVAVSPSLAEEVARLPGMHPARVTVAGSGSSNGVDTLRFAPGGDGAPCRDALGAAPDDVVVGFVGRLGPDKGMTELVDAYAALAGHARCVVVGELEGEHPAAAARLRELGVHVTGFVPDTAPWWAALDVLVLPTHREGFPNVVLEAGACALPTVTTTATGARDSVVDGVTGLLVPVGDAAALTAAVRRLVDDPALRARLGAAARQRVVAEFDQPVVWARYRDLWTGRPA